MRKVILGLAVGIALVGAITFLVKDPERDSNEVIENEPIDLVEDADEILPTASSSGIVSDGSGGAEESLGSDATTDDTGQIGAEVNEVPPEFPIPLPAEFNSLLSGRAGSVHESVERDAFDPVWSPVAELEISNYISGNPEMTTTYGSPTINCRTASCEVAFVAYGIDNSIRASASDESYSADDYTSIDFARATASFWERDGAAEQFGSPAPFSPVYMQTEDGATTILWYLARGVFE